MSASSAERCRITGSTSPSSRWARGLRVPETGALVAPGARVPTGMPACPTLPYCASSSSTQARFVSVPVPSLVMANWNTWFATPGTASPPPTLKLSSAGSAAGSVTCRITCCGRARWWLTVRVRLPRATPSRSSSTCPFPSVMATAWKSLLPLSCQAATMASARGCPSTATSSSRKPWLRVTEEGALKVVSQGTPAHIRMPGSPIRLPQLAKFSAFVSPGGRVMYSSYFEWTRQLPTSGTSPSRKAW
jgi:hypothetical protein